MNEEDIHEYLNRNTVDSNPLVPFDSGSESDDEYQYTVCVKHVPQELKESGLRRAAGRYGKVESMHRMQNPPYNWFIRYKNRS